MVSNYQYDPNEYSNVSAERNNKVGTIESMLSGIASGLIAIPKGFFSLGASLMDLGVNSGKAAAVEQWFDDLTEFDEKAEATAAGKITELLVNIGLPGGLAFKGASNIAKTAMLNGKNSKLFSLTDPKLIKAGDVAKKLTLKGKGRSFMAGAIGGGIAEGVFVGDVEKAGTFGDLLGGPTEINREGQDPNAVREILNRVKFGTEGALFTGVLGGTGKIIGKITNRNKQLDVANSELDNWIDKVASKFRARSGKTEEFFEIERGRTGKRGADALAAKNTSRELEMDIDKMFPSMKTMFDNQPLTKERKKFLNIVNDALVSGDAVLDDAGVATFGKMGDKEMKALKEAIAKYAPNAKAIEELNIGITGSLATIRTKWSKLFTELGENIDQKDLKEFQRLFGGKFKNYMGSTYDIFQNKGILPWNTYKPMASAVKNAQELFKKSYAIANPGKELGDQQALQWVTNTLRTAALPKGFRLDKPSDALFNIPEFFVNRTTLDDAVKRGAVPRISVRDLVPEDQKIFNDLFGKNQNPMQTIIGGTAKLSLITRRNKFYTDLMKKNEEVVKAWRAAPDKQAVAQPMFARSEGEAIAMFGDDFKRIDVIDPAQTLNVNIASGSSNPFGDSAKPFFARRGMAEALEKTGMQIADTGTLGRLYESLILYPKATSQIAKTILSPVTHLRNFVSAGAFAAANGIIPGSDLAAVKQAYQALQTGLKGTRKQNELYEELLELGVVNSNVKLGDLSRLMEDVNFGETMTSDKGMRLLLKPLSRLKSVSQDLYTAEDDFWKIYSWAVEKKRIEASFAKAGILPNQNMMVRRNGVDVKFDEDFLKREAADIVKNNIPNYDYVSDFVKGLRKLPIGNFVSFPAEIARTGTNIVRRALREINETIEIVDGAGKVIKTVKPMQGIGYQRLVGFTTTVAAIPVATTAAFQAIYDVTDDEREAIRRFAAQWSKNSTLLPIKDKETGEFKYIDFSHANAYDTLLRPLQTVLNAVSDGRQDENGMMDDFSKGVLTAMSEFAQPFISEAIWTEAVSDLIMRGGKTREGFQVYSDQDNDGDKMSKIMGHLVRAQMPFSFEQLKRLDRSIRPVDVITKGKYDEYGQEFEFGDEFQGLFGFRAVKVNPDRAMNFKVANYQKGVRDSRGLFTRVSLKGGLIEPREVVDAYLNANRALFNVRKNLKGDMDAAKLLNISEEGFAGSLGRLSRREVGAIDQNIFVPLTISNNVKKEFALNAEKLGVENPLVDAIDTIGDMINKLSQFSLTLPELPTLENPLMPIMQDTPLTPTSLNLPDINAESVAAQVQGGNFTNLTNKQKFDLLFPNG